ncbi:MAG: DUF4157 domain-containing protein [Dehalococcoidia bacterium]|nr:DUF4157 domain-containing protein [Dehalococcoidia bacterium]
MKEALKSTLVTQPKEIEGLLHRFLGTGRRLDLDVERRMEAVFGRNLGDVRIHDTNQAGELAGRLEAEAFTLGPQIFSGPERLAPTSREGLALLGHELTHVVQQTQPDAVLPVQAPMRGYPAMPLALGRASPVGSMTAPGQSTGAPVKAQLSSTHSSTEADASEAQALEVEQATRGMVGGEPAEPKKIEAAEIAERVFRLMLDDLRLERERKTFW